MDRPQPTPAAEVTSHVSHALQASLCLLHRHLQDGALLHEELGGKDLRAAERDLAPTGAAGKEQASALEHLLREGLDRCDRCGSEDGPMGIKGTASRTGAA